VQCVVLQIVDRVTSASVVWSLSSHWLVLGEALLVELPYYTITKCMSIAITERFGVVANHVFRCRCSSFFRNKCFHLRNYNLWCSSKRCQLSRYVRVLDQCFPEKLRRLPTKRCLFKTLLSASTSNLYLLPCTVMASCEKNSSIARTTTSTIGFVAICFWFCQATITVGCLQCYSVLPIVPSYQHHVSSAC